MTERKTRFPIGYRFIDDGVEWTVTVQPTSGPPSTSVIVEPPDDYIVRTTDFQYRSMTHAEIKACESVHKHPLRPIGTKYRMSDTTRVWEIIEYRPSRTLPQIDYLVLDLDDLSKTVVSHSWLSSHAHTEGQG